MTVNESTPELEAPGAGLPLLQGFLARHIIFPVFCGYQSWNRSELVYKQESDLILNDCVHLHPEDLTKPILIDRIMGIEDSSRYWSVSMTLEHLMIVGEAVRTTIISLSRGYAPDFVADTAAVKPVGKYGHEVIELFRGFVDDYVWKIQEKAEDRNSATTFEHPWFGPLTAYQWVVMGAMHQRIHRRQIERICAGLESYHQ
ncbi:MAG: hypothetical protein AAF649_06415 [Verrucomicrobiota bacterium]